jgi:hypothetical protein
MRVVCLLLLLACFSASGQKSRTRASQSRPKSRAATPAGNSQPSQFNAPQQRSRLQQRQQQTGGQQQQQTSARNDQRSPVQNQKPIPNNAYQPRKRSAEESARLKKLGKEYQIRKYLEEQRKLKVEIFRFAELLIASCLVAGTVWRCKVSRTQR